MTRVLIRVLFVASTLAAIGCGSTVVVPPAVDGGVVCRFPDGGECRPGQSCPSPDGCNTCACSADGTLACTARACVDAGPPDVPSPRACQSTADCNRGDECHITEGCATPSYCGPALGRPCTGDLTPYCGCDGSTFLASSTCPTRTYARRGRCEAVDAGAPACVFPDGRECALGQRCPAPDGCNTCTCTTQGLACTEIACVDGGPPRDGGGGGTCQSSADCPPSSMCHGALGCDIPWRCVPAMGCTADLAPFCGCDGVSFEGSSSCPGRPYRARGRCPARDGGLACATLDARGEGDCDGYFGVAWNGSTCASITGCRCVGADCGRVFRDRAECVAACGI